LVKAVAKAKKIRKNVKTGKKWQNGLNMSQRVKHGKKGKNVAKRVNNHKTGTRSAHSVQLGYG
jgi:hypothetical protein